VGFAFLTGALICWFLTVFLSLLFASEPIYPVRDFGLQLGFVLARARLGVVRVLDGV
jgi:hypothetical protein